MPILLETTKKNPANIAFKAAIYLLLILGAVFIVYPVLIVVGQTLSNDFDLQDNSIVPRYLYSQNQLLLKNVHSFSDNLNILAARHHRPEWRNLSGMKNDRDYFQQLTGAIKEKGFSWQGADKVLADYRKFKNRYPQEYLLAKKFSATKNFGTYLVNRYGKAADVFLEEHKNGKPLPHWFLRRFPDENKRRKILDNPDKLALVIMNHSLDSDYSNFYEVEARTFEPVMLPTWRPTDNPKEQLWLDFKKSLPANDKLLLASNAYWQNFLMKTYPSITKLNKDWKTGYRGFAEITFNLKEPANPEEAAVWRTFVRERWPRNLMCLPESCAISWRKWVKQRLLAKYAEKNDANVKALAEASLLCGKPLRNWEQLPFYPKRPDNEILSRYWCEFIASGKIPPKQFILKTPEEGFISFLKKKYGNGKSEKAALQALNMAWKSNFKSFSDIELPMAIADLKPVVDNPWKLRKDFASHSYTHVIGALKNRGQAVVNTIILVVLTLLCTFTINPLAAYSLSRFPLKHSGKMLLFFLATMAFPAEVAMIPNFLLIRDMGMLNTYLALVLPAAANGFSIFLLKGFFDSLPRELFEAAEIDGASEIKIFRIVVIPLTLPIMAYIGLGAFIMAYSGFMWAFVICPDQKMWTLMVWIYDLQTQNPGNNYIMAASLLAGIPPLLIFLVANRIILRGIIIPSMK